MVRFFKFLAADLTHNGFTYKEGLNVDHVPFDASGSCQPGGLYFTDFEHLHNWCKAIWPLVADVTLPDDACVYAEPCGTKWKADKIVLSNIRPISEFLPECDEAMCIAAVQTYGYGTLKYVRNQTDAICLAAVQYHGRALKYVRNQTDVICRAAVWNHGSALEFVQNQNDWICWLAVQKNGFALEYVQNQTDELCLAAVHYYGRALKYVQNQTEEICRAAFAQDPSAKEYVKIPIDL